MTAVFLIIFNDHVQSRHLDLLRSFLAVSQKSGFDEFEDAFCSCLAFPPNQISLHHFCDPSGKEEIITIHTVFFSTQSFGVWGSEAGRRQCEERNRVHHRFNSGDRKSEATRMWMSGWEEQTNVCCHQLFCSVWKCWRSCDRCSFIQKEVKHAFSLSWCYLSFEGRK